MKKCTIVCEMGFRQQEGCRFLEAAARFGRMWGIMETMGAFEKVPDFLEEEAVRKILAWTEEFFEKEAKDPVGFFEEKLRTVSRPKEG